jgi:hypothetical protein
LQEHPKFTQIGIFWVENMPSGNPGTEMNAKSAITNVKIALRMYTGASRQKLIC